MITGPLCGESAGHRWFTSQNASIGDLLIVNLDMLKKNGLWKYFQSPRYPSLHPNIVDFPKQHLLQKPPYNAILLWKKWTRQ